MFESCQAPSDDAGEEEASVPDFKDTGITEEQKVDNEENDFDLNDTYVHDQGSL